MFTKEEWIAEEIITLQGYKNIRLVCGYIADSVRNKGSSVLYSLSNNFEVKCVWSCKKFVIEIGIPLGEMIRIHFIVAKLKVYICKFFIVFIN